MKLLVTGSNPMGHGPRTRRRPSCGSWLAAPRNDLTTTPTLRVAILPCEFANAEREICELLQADVPDVLLALGVAPRAQGLRLERTARNRDDAALPDNAGEQRQLTPIVPGGPDTSSRRYRSRRCARRSSSAACKYRSRMMLAVMSATTSSTPRGMSSTAVVYRRTAASCTFRCARSKSIQRHRDRRRALCRARNWSRPSSVAFAFCTGL